MGTSEHEDVMLTTPTINMSPPVTCSLLLLSEVSSTEPCDPFPPYRPLQKKFGIDKTEHAEILMAALDTFFFTMSAHVSAATPLSTNTVTPSYCPHLQSTACEMHH